MAVDRVPRYEKARSDLLVTGRLALAVAPHSVPDLQTGPHRCWSASDQGREE